MSENVFDTLILWSSYIRSGCQIFLSTLFTVRAVVLGRLSLNMCSLLSDMESECFPCIPLTRASHEPFTVKSEPVSPPSPPLSNTSHLSEVKQEPGIQV